MAEKINSIITIGRQYGSAGREIGYKLADYFGIKLYDKEMLAVAAKESGICEEIFETHDEKPTSSFLYSLIMDTYSMGFSGSTYSEMPINHKVFLAQFDAIKKIADYALEERKDVINIFIHADLDARIRRIAREYDLTDAKAKDKIIKTDKKRASYYNYYTNKKWSDSSSYELSISSSELGVDGAVQAIIEYIKVKESLKNTRL